VIAAHRAQRPRLLLGDETLAAGEARVGGKALGLARLVAAGARVPDFFVVPVDVFADALDGAGQTAMFARALAELSASRATVEETAATLQLAVRALRLPGAVARELEDALGAIGVGPYAVRSSMVGEDSATRSFAGQLDSFLHQRADDVAAAIVGCWASAFGARALAYQLQGGGASLPRVAVVVQRMVDGRVSGVLFTANPVDGNRDETVLSAAFGLGEGVVSGACNADEFVWSRTTGERAAIIAHKDRAIVRAPGGVGTEEVAVDAARAETRTLAPVEVAIICCEGAGIADALGAPQDIEWTLADDGLYLLQARPITARALRAAGPRVVWDNSNIQESYCGVTTPLTFSFAADCYASVYTQTLRALGVPRATIDAYEPVLRNLLGLVGGRVYYNINNWYRALLVLPSFGRNKHDMEQMMGLESPVDFIEDQVLSTGERLRRAPRMGVTLARMLASFATLEARVDAFLRQFDATMAGYDRARLADASLSELMALRERARVELIGRWHTPILNDLYVMMACGRLRRIVERAAGGEAPRLMSSLLAADEGVASVEPTRLLLRIARTIRATDGAVARLTDGEPLDALAALRARFAEIGAALDDYLERYGDRSMGELKLETISLRQDPSFVVQVLRNYVAQPALDPDALARDEKARRQVAEAEVAAKLGPVARARFRRALVAARRGIAAREAMRLARTRAFGLHRDLYLAVGQRLHEAGRLDAPRDVFYLTVQEIAAYHDGTSVCADLAALARVRRAEFARYEAEELPNRFETAGAVYHGNRLAPPAASDAERAASLLRGLGCSPGVVEAPLAVIARPDDDLALDGKILTALRTDPGWAPLFPSARAILVERGSTLSHSAVLARELGIPAVVGVPNLLRIVQNGERVRLDGAAGTVERLERP
jgi:pyruvate,water dikinase